MRESIELELEILAAALDLPPQERSKYVRRACGKNRELCDRVEALLASANSASAELDRQQSGETAASPPLSARPIDQEVGPYQPQHKIGVGRRSEVLLAELVADLRRFLGHEPIPARPRSVIHSLRRFAERHRWAFVASVGVILLLIVATTASTWWAVREFRAKQVARNEANTQQELVRFFRNDVLALASPEQNPDRALTLRTVLDRAAQKIQGRFVGQPLVEASIRSTVAETYQSLGEYAAAETHFRRAWSLYKEELGPTDRKSLFAARKVVGTLTDQGLYDKAEPLARQVLTLHQRSLGSTDPDTLDAMYHLAVPLFMKGERPVATQLLIETLNGYKLTLGPLHPDTLNVMNELGDFYLTDSKPAEAQKLLLQALYLRREAFGATHPATIMVLSNLAAAYADMSRYDEAEPLMAQAVSLRQRILGPDHPSTLTSMNNLATLYADQGRFAESAQLQARTIELGQKRLGAEHPGVMIWMNNLGMTYLDEHKVEDAYRVLNRTLEQRRKVLGVDHPDTLISMSNLGFVQHRRGQLAQAEALLSSAWAASERVLGADSSERLVIGERLAVIWIDRKKFAAADSLLRTVGEARRTRFPDDWRTFLTLSKRGQLLVRLGRYAEAEPLLIDSYLELTERVQSIPENQKFVLTNTSDSLFKLYAAWNQPDKRLAWEREFQSRRGKLEAHRPAQ